MFLTALIATEHETQDGRRFSAASLDDLAAEVTGVEANVEFDSARPLGKVVGAIRTAEGVEVTIETWDEKLPEGFFVPHVNFRGNGNPVERVDSVRAVALTGLPADLTLTKWNHLPPETFPAEGK
jgi:hypothetical protein